jgi:hypothetical protein
MYAAPAPASWLHAADSAQVFKTVLLQRAAANADNQVQSGDSGLWILNAACQAANFAERQDLYCSKAF